MRNVLKICLLFLIWRLLLFVPLIYAQNHIPWQKDSAQYIMWAYTRPYPPISNFLIYPWANFDGVHYLTIASDANYLHGSDGRFMPFYPTVTSAVINVTGGSNVFFSEKDFLSAFFVANIAFLLGLIVLYKLITLDYSDKIAFQTIIFLLVFPTSFFFGCLYSESIFFLLTVSIFYFLRTYKFLFATILSMFLLVTRVVGIFILPVLAYAIMYHDRHIFLKEQISKNKKKIIQDVLLISLIPLGLLGFMWLNKYFWGDPFFFVHAQEYVVNGRSAGIVFFPQTVFRYIKILLTVPKQQFIWWISVLELGSFLFGAILFVYAFVKKIPLMYILFSLLCFLIPTQSGTFSGLPRYILVLFPLFLTLALINNKWIKIIYVTIGIISLFFLLAFFSKGYFIA